MTPRSFFAGGEPLDFDSARYSGLSAGVPGTVATWQLALDRYGTRSLGRALQPGIAVAEHGFRIDRTFFGQIELNRDFFDDVPSTAAIYLDGDGTPRDVGTRQRNPDMARAYERIARLGARGFYRGPIAAAMARAARRPPVAEDADHEWLAGLLGKRDLKRYEALAREPTRVGYRGYDVWGMPPPSSGGSTVGEALNILEGYSPLGLDRAQALHRFLEASRYAFADRNAYVADPAYFDVPLDGLLSDSFAAERRALITDQAADAGPVDPGQPDDNAPAGRIGIDREGKSTTHLTVVDRDGTTVAYTFTIESTGGNGIVVPRWGFLLNNELTDFNYDDPRHPNAPAGGKRPRSSMAPTIVTRAGAAGARARLPGRLDDHHHGPADPARAARPRQDAARGDRRAARVAAELRGDHGRGGLPPLARGPRPEGPLRARPRPGRRRSPRDRRGHRDRVPRRRRSARGRGAGAPRRRHRDGRGALARPFPSSGDAG